MKDRPDGSHWVTICEHDAAGRPVACHPVLIHENGRTRPEHRAYHQLTLDQRQIAAAAREHERRMRDERRRSARNQREEALIAKQDLAYRKAAEREAAEEARQWRQVHRNFLANSIKPPQPTMEQQAKGIDPRRSDEYRYLPRWVKSNQGQTPDVVAEDFNEQFPGVGVEDEQSLRDYISYLDAQKKQDRPRTLPMTARRRRRQQWQNPQPASEELLYEVAF